jgi:hypothetical protein
VDLTPFSLLEPDEPGGAWQLVLTAIDSLDSRSVFEEANRHAGGYGWEGVALYFLEQVLESEAADCISLDCENDTFVARSTDPTALRRLAELVAPLAKDRKALAAILRRAPLDGWTQLLLRR